MDTKNLIQTADQLRLTQRFNESLEILLPLTANKHDVEIFRFIARNYEGLFEWSKALETWEEQQKVNPINAIELRTIPGYLVNL
jgi:hypothetical protein